MVVSGCVYYNLLRLPAAHVLSVILLMVATYQAATFMKHDTIHCCIPSLLCNILTNNRRILCSVNMEPAGGAVSPLWPSLVSVGRAGEGHCGSTGSVYVVFLSWPSLCKITKVFDTHVSPEHKHIYIFMCSPHNHHHNPPRYQLLAVSRRSLALYQHQRSGGHTHFLLPIIIHP